MDGCNNIGNRILVLVYKSREGNYQSLNKEGTQSETSRHQSILMASEPVFSTIFESLDW